MLPSRGRPGLILNFEILGALSADDILRLATQPGPKKSNVPMLQRLKARHHSVAIALASGKSITDAALDCGYTTATVGNLLRDPSFLDILRRYEAEITAGHTDQARKFQGIMLAVATAASEEILDRLDDPIEVKKIPLSELRQLNGDALNRTALPPKIAAPPIVAPTVITFNMGNRTLPAPSSTKDIDHEPLKLPEPAEPSPD